MADDEQLPEPTQEPHALTRDEIFAARLLEFDAPSAGVRMVELSHKNAVALEKDSEDRNHQHPPSSPGPVRRNL